MEFEKWQALGNDYVIVEAAQLPFELTAPRIRAICAAHTGVAADGILLLSEPEHDGYVARLRIFNPDGSEAELSGNGAREAVLYLRRHRWTDADTFAIQTLSGDIRPVILSDTSARSTWDRRACRARASLPAGQTGGANSLPAGAAGAFSTSRSETPNAPSTSRTKTNSTARPENHRPRDRAQRLFPNRTNVSWFAGPDSDPAHPRIRARIFERGVGETTASGTGATGAAVAYVLDGGRSPVTVVLDGGELTVEVADDLRVKLTGWAVPVYRATLAETFLEELHATE